MKKLRTEIEIQASPKLIWDILMNFKDYPQWNPFIQDIQGEGVVGGRLVVHICLPGGRLMVFRPTVTRIQKQQAFQWLGRLIIPGVFDGEHRFEIEPVKTDKVRFIHCETFQGVLVPLFWRSIDTQVRQGFEEMNRSLKMRAERLYSELDT